MSKGIVDTHTHVLNEYYDDVSSVINASINSGVRAIINSAVDRDTMEEIIVTSSKYDNVYITLGIHPSEVLKYKEDDLIFLENNISNKLCVAVGEIGLDYYYEKDSRDKQIELFEKQLDIASRGNMPVVIHSREATKDTIDILKKYNVKGVIHSFSGSVESAKTYINMGFCLGVNGVVTFKNCNMKDVYREIGISNLVFETDAPYLAPVPYRGKQNKPEYIVETMKYLADYMLVSTEDMLLQSNKNVLDLFGIE